MDHNSLNDMDLCSRSQSCEKTRICGVILLLNSMKLPNICDALPQKVHKVAGSERRYTPEQVV